MDLINTSRRSRGLRVQIQLSTGVPTKVTTLDVLTSLRRTFFKFIVEVEDDI
jgi:hypothetical protein